jgi:hypothetical protein
MNIQALYETDFNAWIQEHILLLKESRFNEIDAVHLINELEDMGKSNQRELESRLECLIMHLLKWQYQPNKRSNSWQATIKEQRRRLNRLLKDAPSLKNKMDEAIAIVYADAVDSACGETGLAQTVFPNKCTYRKEQILDNEYYPS